MPARTEAITEDLRLMEAVKVGDASALAALWDRHAGAVLGLCRRILGDDGEAEEVTLDAFVQAWEQGDRYQPGRASPLTWLLMIARSRAIDRARASGRRRQVSVPPDDRRLLQGLEDQAAWRRDAPDRPLLEEEQRVRVRGALGELPEVQREAVELSFLEGLTHREIAERLEAPLGTIKTRIRHGLLRLRERLEGAEPGSGRGGEGAP